MPLRTPVGRFALAVTSMGLSLGLTTSIAFAQLQTPVYPEGTVPGIPAPQPNPNGPTPGDPGAGAGSPMYPGGAPVYPGGRPPTVQTPRPDAPRSASPPAPGVNAGPGASTSTSPSSSSPSVYQSQGSGDGRLPPSIYSRDPRGGLPSSPGGSPGSGVR